MRCISPFTLIVVAGLVAGPLGQPLLGQIPPQPDEWTSWGRDAGGSRYAPLDQINRSNVGELRPAWSYSTGEWGTEFRVRGNPRLSATPLMVGGVLYLGTPLGRVIALDPDTGEELWSFDPGVDGTRGYGDFTNRGVAAWSDPDAVGNRACALRIFIGTIDARLIGLDGHTGAPCTDFGDDGQVDLRQGLRIPPFEFPAYQLTSPPAVVGNLIITGSAIADNSRTNPASGEVRAWDARTGELRWSWDPIPQAPADAAYDTWAPGSAEVTGGANVWSVMSVDSERGLVFLPTTNPAPDYYGGLRLGRNLHAGSIVALNAATGELVWSFQTVRHDLWDYDNAAQPVLATLTLRGEEVPAVLVVTKTAQLFVLHRETGEPLFEVEERPVPASDVPGEEAWPTQIFSREIEPLSPLAMSSDEVWGLTEEDRALCRSMVAELRNEGIFTPPSLEGTLVIPSNIGGAHWGGLAFHPGSGFAVVPVNRLAAMVQLIPLQGFDRAAAQAESDRLGLGYQYTAMRGTPYAMRRRFLLSSSGLPCSPPPFGALVAVDLRTGERVWERPLGDAGALLPDGGPAGFDTSSLGLPSLGGPIATAGGLVFVAGTPDNLLRAFDVETGQELWRGELPAGGRGTPMTYRSASGRQFVVVAAGGGGDLWGRGDRLVAFALPDESGAR
jgi:quinoprotein glucose dehydrogenase